MRLQKIVLITTLIAIAATLQAQSRKPEVFGVDPGQTPVLETSLGYTFEHANAPPAQCGCFSANGGYGSVVLNMPHGFSFVADLSAVHANNLNGTTQSITVFHDLFGPRYSLRSKSRYVPYIQALGGHAEEFSNYAYVKDVGGPAFSLGGGVTTGLKRHFAWTIVEADWVQSRLPNALNNVQNDLRVNTGFSFRIGPR